MTPELDEATVKIITDGKKVKLVIDSGKAIFEESDPNGKPTHGDICSNNKLGTALEAPGGTVYEVDYAGILERKNGRLKLTSGSGSCVHRHPITANADALKLVETVTGEKVEVY